MPIDMLSKESINLGTIKNESSGLEIHNNQSTIMMTLTKNLLTTNPRHKKRRVRERQRMTLQSGVTYTKSPGTTSMNVTQNFHLWLRSKTRSRTMIQNIIKTKDHRCRPQCYCRDQNNSMRRTNRS
jgi:hypothetical protein